MRNKKKGFTLVELIVVIAIIGVLAAIIVPTTLHFVNQARDQAATEELDRVVSAFDSGLTEVIANMSGTDKIEAADIASIVSKAGIRTMNEKELKVVVALKDKDVNKLTELLSEYKIKAFKQVKFTLEDYFMQFYREDKDFGGVKWKKKSKKQ